MSMEIEDVMRINLTIKSKETGTSQPVVLYTDESEYVIVDLEMAFNDFYPHREVDERVVNHFRNLVGHDIVIEARGVRFYEKIIIEGTVENCSFPETPTKRIEA